MSIAQHILVFGIRIYQRLISPLLTFVSGPGCGCRFTPTCSHYAVEAVKVYGAFAGSWMAVKRIGRCQPWGGCGHDPVPAKDSQISNIHSLQHGS